MAKILLYIAAILGIIYLPYHFILAGTEMHIFLFAGIFGLICFRFLPKRGQGPFNVTLRWIIWVISLGIMLWQSFPNGLPNLDNNDIAYRITATKLNVRSAGDKTAKVLYQLEKGDKVQPISHEPNWTKITTSKGEGYVASEFISQTKEDNMGFLLLAWIFLGVFMIVKMLNIKGGSGGSYETDDNKYKIASVHKENSFVVVYNARGSKIGRLFLKDDNEYLDYSGNFFLTFKPTGKQTNTNAGFLTAYSPKGKKIARKYLDVQERFYECTDDYISILKGNFITIYDQKFNKIDRQYIR